jgi:iron complex outermembrane receptor protein
VFGAWAGHSKSWDNGISAHAMATLTHTPYGTDGTFGAEVFVPLRRFWYLRGMALRSMRLPTFTDLYYNVATYHPNPNLRPETAMTYRLTAGKTRIFGSDKWSGEASLWYRRTRDVIDWEQRPDPDPALNGHWWSTQLNRLGTVGTEFSMRYSDNNNWFRTAMLNYGYVHSDMTVATGYISKYALDYMRHKLSAVVGVAFLRSFSLTLTGSLYDRIGSYIAANDVQTGYKPYFLLDGRLAWEPRTKGRTGVQLYLDVTNITATRYFDYGGLPMPGAWASGGVVITIK